MSSLLAFLAPTPGILPVLLPAPLPDTLPAPLPSRRSVAFTEYRNLVIKFPELNAGSYITTYQAETIWIQEQQFTFYEDAWR